MLKEKEEEIKQLRLLLFKYDWLCHGEEEVTLRVVFLSVIDFFSHLLVRIYFRLRNRIGISREQAGGGAIQSGEDGNGQSPHLMINGESDYEPLKQVQVGPVLLLNRVRENWGNISAANFFCMYVGRSAFLFLDLI